MKKHLLMVLLIIAIFVNIKNTKAQVLEGYSHNWRTANPPYIELTQINSTYTNVLIAFVVPKSPTNMTMTFAPDGITPAIFIAQIQTMESRGKKILLSIGGATASINLADTINRDLFINSIDSLLNIYPVHGLDFDIENGDGILASGTIANPTSPGCINLIYAINRIKTYYYNRYGRTMMLTFAPETAYVQGGIAAYGNVWGGYLPIINYFRNDISYIHVQLYNSGTMYGLDGFLYAQATADFIVAMSEALIRGFNTAGGYFQGIPANKVVIGLPACPSAAGGGFTSTTVVASAIKYLRGMGPKPGSYTLIQAGGYPNIGGMMDWSINWDSVTTCNATSYEFAKNYQLIFNSSIGINSEETKIKYKLEQNYPNPFNSVTRIIYSLPKNELVILKIYDVVGKEVKTLINEQQISGDYEFLFDAKDLSSGVYFYKFESGEFMETKKMLLIK